MSSIRAAGASPMKKRNAPDTPTVIPFPDVTISSAEAFPGVVAPIYDEVTKKYGPTHWNKVAFRSTSHRICWTSA